MDNFNIKKEPFILLPNQLFGENYFPFRPQQIFIYLHGKFLATYGKNISAEKEKYMFDCINNYRPFGIKPKIIKSIKSIDVFCTFEPTDHDIRYEYTQKNMRSEEKLFNVYGENAPEAIDVDFLNPRYVSTRLLDWKKNVYDEAAEQINAAYVANNKKRTGAVYIFDSPSFILTTAHINSYIQKYVGVGKQAHSMYTFYKFARVKLQKLINGKNKPVGGKWSFDDLNRKSLDHVPEHRKLNFPTTAAAALQYLKNYVATYLNLFGPFQDAISESNLIYHSGISPMLNNGLLTPWDVFKCLEGHEEKIVRDEKKAGGLAKLASYEGFLRQIMGWREFMRIIYYRQLQTQHFKLENQFGAKKKLNNNWYVYGTDKSDKLGSLSGVGLVDYCVAKANTTGYLHHIERLMVVGCFMFMSQFKPIDVCTWFTTQFLDSYEWVMFGNVYYMSQFVAPYVTKRPYICSSNYIINMADLSAKKYFGKTDILAWDNVYMRFVLKNKNVLKKYYMMYVHIKKAENMATNVL